jgi:hypothetical protein
MLAGLHGWMAAKVQLLNLKKPSNFDLYSLKLELHYYYYYCGTGVDSWV